MVKNILQRKKILIISPHPDDEAICCGGLIMLARKYQTDVFVYYISVGPSRQFLTGKTTASTRIPEIKKAAQFGGFKYKIAFQGKQFMRLDSLPQKDIIEPIEDITQNFKPDIVCTPFRNSFDQDHRAIAVACMTAYRPLPSNLRHQPNMILECEEPYSWSVGQHFTPNLYFDISDVFEKKIDLLKRHASQLRQDPFPRSPQNLKRLAGLRGCEIGAKYAEGYRLLKGILV
jgi:LmbE family N-acetylglucosaminyl deacetylase